MFSSFQTSAVQMPTCNKFETIVPVCLRGCTNEDHFQTLACKTAIKRL